jgi:aconitase A
MVTPQEYLKKSGLMPYLEDIGFGVVGYCNTNATPLEQHCNTNVPSL